MIRETGSYNISANRLIQNKPYKLARHLDQVNKTNNTNVLCLKTTTNNIV